MVVSVLAALVFAAAFFLYWISSNEPEPDEGANARGRESECQKFRVPESQRERARVPESE